MKKSWGKMLVKPFNRTQRSLLVKRETNISPFDTHDKTILKRVLKHLREKKKKKQGPVEESCPVEDSTETRIDSQVKLRCRQLTNVVQEMRKAIMRHDWPEVTTLLLILCHPGLKLYSTIIIRACFVLLYNHPDSSLDLVQSFIRDITEYVLDEDVNKFIRLSFVLRKTGLEPITRGFLAKSSCNKVIRDPEFDNL